MSIQALNWAMNKDEIKNSNARFVLMILANYADENGYCYPSRENIAKKTSIEIRTVQTHLNWLVAKGYIEKTNRRNASNKIQSNLYRILFEKPSANFAQGDQKPSANFAEKPSANFAPNTKESKEDTKGFSDDTKTSSSSGGATRLQNRTEIPVNDSFNENDLTKLLMFVQQRQNCIFLPYEKDYPAMWDRFVQAGVTLEVFKEYYLHLEKEPKIKNITPNVLLNQFSAYQNRDAIAAKKSEAPKPFDKRSKAEKSQDAVAEAIRLEKEKEVNKGEQTN